LANYLIVYTTMIFPDLPKHYSWMQTAPELLQNRTGIHTLTETPLRGLEDVAGQSKITVEEWWIKHGLATDPAAVSRHSEGEPINWWAKDALEFYALCVTMVCWIVYWYGVHRGLW
jgi:hypothetical protein